MVCCTCVLCDELDASNRDTVRAGVTTLAEMEMVAFALEVVERGFLRMCHRMELFDTKQILNYF